MTAAAAFARYAQARSQRTGLALGALAVALVVVFVFAIGHGAVSIEPGRVVAILLERIGLIAASQADATEQAVLLSIRLPRAVLGVLVGAGLAVAGGALQGLFRNPLADPALIGISTGAALFAAVTIVLGGLAAAHLPAGLIMHLLPLAAFAGALLTTFVVYRIATREGRTDVATMLLAGVALNAITAAGIGLLIFISSEQQLRDINFWLLGSLGGASWERLMVAGPLMLAPALALPFLARQLNALALGETEAHHLGFDVERVKRITVVLAALAAGAAVALCGVIGFVGLLVPHLLRLVLGPDHRTLLPAAALLGAILLLIADLLARTIVLPAELPIGILTSCIGGPFFLWLLVRRRGFGVW
ncbi:MAG: FecCD family ABC transporter permease [Alphaproteobacteria bacterium]